MPRRPGKNIIESVKRKGEEAVNRVGYLINTREKEKDKYKDAINICDRFIELELNKYTCDRFIELELNKYIAIVHFVEANYKITEEERSEFMKFYWDIYEILEREVKLNQRDMYL